MAYVNTHQLAELLVGIARAQQAVIDAVESSKAGFKSTHLSPALWNVARVRDTHRALQLSDLPARVLLQCMGRMGPNVDQVAKDLDELIARDNASSGSVPPDSAPGADSLDMTK